MKTGGYAFDYPQNKMTEKGANLNFSIKNTSQTPAHLLQIIFVVKNYFKTLKKFTDSVHL